MAKEISFVERQRMLVNKIETTMNIYTLQETLLNELLDIVSFMAEDRMLMHERNLEVTKKARKF